MYYINFQIINQNLLSSNQIGGFFYFFYQEKTKSSKNKDFYHWLGVAIRAQPHRDLPKFVKE